MISELVRVESPATINQSGVLRLPDYRYAAEGAGRSAATFHTDLAAGVRFGGPGRSQMRIGISVINLAFGPVAPQVPVSPAELLLPDRTLSPEGVLYKRLFTLPPVPSLTGRIEF